MNTKEGLGNKRLDRLIFYHGCLLDSGPSWLPADPWECDGNKDDRDSLDTQVREMMGCGGVIEENAEHACEPGTAHGETGQQEALVCARWRSQAPHQKEPDTELEPSVEGANLGQGTRVGLKLGLLRKERRGC